MSRVTLTRTLVALAVVPFACATPEETTFPLGPTGGSSGGQTTSSGGSTGGSVANTGGAVATGGIANSGGTISTGGVTSTGGLTTTGGVSTGGVGTTTGGVSTTTGGTVGKGGSAGMATGGTTGKGGSAGMATGGATSTGGVTATGGKATGGTLATGGVTTTGGTATGGTLATGGATTTGGTATGGTLATGGTTGCGVCVVHRYSFAGTGTTVTDSVGTAHGTAMNTTVASGAVALAGTTSDQYVDLPASVLSGLTNATFEAWVTWSAGAAWQRIFDFGDNDGAGAGSQGTNGVTYFFLSPKAVNNTGHLRVAYTLSGPTGETKIDAPAALPSGAIAHVAVVVDQTASTLALYVNGAASASTTLSSPLSSINNVNNWLGRSQFATDPEFGGSVQEFRVYSVARSAAQLQASYTAGPDALPAN